MIESQDISVVVQGDINERYILECLSSLRKFLPNAEIILSTWRNNENKVKELVYDALILSEDPGAFPLNKKETKLNNINRQIISTQAGIKIASKKYILKIRSDMSLCSNVFLKYFESFSETAQIFHNRLLILNFYTRNPRVIPMPFCFSDWVLFGNSEDVCKYYDIPLQSDTEIMWYRTHINKSKFFNQVYALFAPEQHIAISLLKKEITFSCSTYYDISNHNILLTEKILAENVIVVDLEKSGFKFLKYNPNRYFEKSSLISHSDWKEFYNHYVLKNNSSWHYYLFKIFFRRIFYMYFRRQITAFLKKIKLDLYIKKILNYL